MNALLDRIAALTSIARTRGQDATRTERNGGSNGELTERVESVIATLKKTVADLEKAVA